MSIRDNKRSTKVSVGAIQKPLTKANELGLTRPLPGDLDDNGLAQPFYPRTDKAVSSRHQIPDCPDVHQKLKLKGMTKLLLWEEYTREYRNRCYSYSQFCDRYQRCLI